MDNVWPKISQLHLRYELFVVSTNVSCNWLFWHRYLKFVSISMITQVFTVVFSYNTRIKCSVVTKVSEWVVDMLLSYLSIYVNIPIIKCIQTNYQLQTGGKMIIPDILLTDKINAVVIE